MTKMCSVRPKYQQRNDKSSKICHKMQTLKTRAGQTYSHSIMSPFNDADNKLIDITHKSNAMLTFGKSLYDNFRARYTFF